MRLDKIGIQQILGIAANPATKGEVNIIDVSGYTGPIDYAQLEPYVQGIKEPRIDGAIVRLTDGATDDVYGVANYNGFKALGLPVGGYGVHYVRASATSNKRQAERLVDVVQSLGEYPALGVYGDWERNPDKIGISAARQAIWKYITTVEDEFDKILKAYSNYWWDANVANPTNGNTDIPNGRDYWTASWYAKKPYVTYDWRFRYGSDSLDAWILWQYENRFKFPGVPGSVDMSTFNGTLAQYYAYFDLPGAPPPPPPPPPGEDEMRYKVIVTPPADPYLNVRQGPGTNTAIVGTMPNGTIFTISDVKLGYPACSLWSIIKDGEYDGKYACLELNKLRYCQVV